MFAQILGSKKLTLILLTIFIGITLFSWTISQSRASETSNIMYFIPEDSSLIETEVLPSVFNGVESQNFTYVNEVGNTSDWEVIRKLALDKELDALIIHHAVQDRVNWEEVRDWFQKENLIVAGIGMAGDELATLLGAPGLFIRQGAEEMSFDYFIYQVFVSGQPEDEQKVIDAGFNSEDVETIQSPLSAGGTASRGFLFGEQGDITTFLGTLNGHFINREMNKES